MNHDGPWSETLDTFFSKVKEPLDDNRLSAIRTDPDGIMQTVDEILTSAASENLSLEDVRMVLLHLRHDP